jgi:hypothetical protein
VVRLARLVAIESAIPEGVVAFPSFD